MSVVVRLDELRPADPELAVPRFYFMILHPSRRIRGSAIYKAELDRNGGGDVPHKTLYELLNSTLIIVFCLELYWASKEYALVGT